MSTESPSIFWEKRKIRNWVTVGPGIACSLCVVSQVVSTITRDDTPKKAFENRAATRDVLLEYTQYVKD